LLSGSPSIDTGNEPACAFDSVKNLDQHGIRRPQGARCDMGTFELEQGGFMVIPLRNGKTVVMPMWRPDTSGGNDTHIRANISRYVA